MFSKTVSNSSSAINGDHVTAFIMRVTKNQSSIYGGATKGVNARNEKQNKIAETASETHPIAVRICTLY